MKLITDLQKEENMTREEANKALPTLQAFAEGKVIQMLDDRSIWTDLTEREGLPIGTLGESPNIFRIKPESKYRSFANAEECLQEMQKHQPFGWIKAKEGGYQNIISVDNFYAGLGDKDGSAILLASKNSYQDNTFFDGTPFGIKLEE